MKDDTISRQAVINLVESRSYDLSEREDEWAMVHDVEELPTVQPTLYVYNIEHLELIARVLRKEDLPPERIAEVLTDIGSIVAIVKAEYEEVLRKEVERCMI